MTPPRHAFAQEVQGRIVARLGELTAQNIELGAMGDAMGERLAQAEAQQSFLDGLVACLAAGWLGAF